MSTTLIQAVWRVLAPHWLVGSNSRNRVQPVCQVGRGQPAARRTRSIIREGPRGSPRGPPGPRPGGRAGLGLSLGHLGRPLPVVPPVPASCTRCAGRPRRCPGAAFGSRCRCHFSGRPRGPGRPEVARRRDRPPDNPASRILPEATGHGVLPKIKSRSSIFAPLQIPLPTFPQTVIPYAASTFVGTCPCSDELLAICYRDCGNVA